MRTPLKLKDGEIREESDHLIISLYESFGTCNIGISYFALFNTKRATEYILYKIEELQRGQMSC